MIFSTVLLSLVFCSGQPPRETPATISRELWAERLAEPRGRSHMKFATKISWQEEKEQEARKNQSGFFCTIQ